MSRVKTLLHRALRAGREPVDRAHRAFRQQRARVYAVEIHSKWLGFFAQLEWALEILAYAEETEQAVQLRLTGPQYVSPARGSDFLRYFFDPVHAERPLAPQHWHRISELGELRLPRDYDKTFTFETAHSLFFVIFDCDLK